MKKIAIITDTNSGMSPEAALESGILMIPMPINVDGREYFEYADITQAKFFEYLSAGASVSTSQPAPGVVTGYWEKALETHDQIIYIPMSSALSGSCQSAKLFAEDYDGRVFVVDNCRISVSQKESALNAVYWRDQGLSAEEIVEKLMDSALEASIYISVDDLNYLKRGGRITPSVAAIGTVLNIKPVLKIQGGKLDTFKKVRGWQTAMRTMIDAAKADMENRFRDIPFHLYVAYAGDPELGEKWRKHVQEKFPEYEVKMDPLPLSIACHAGPGAIGIGLVRKFD